MTGFLQEVLFKEGESSRQGDVLYRIEPDTFQAAVQQAQGALLRGAGQVRQCHRAAARTQELVKTDAASRRRSTGTPRLKRAPQGDVVIADANLKTANVNLGYTDITAPITGEIGRTKLTKGNVVGPDSGPLTVIVSRDPMYVTFPVSQREFLNVQRRRTAQGEAAALAVRIRFSDGSTYDQSGRINFVDVTVDRATDTVLVRATLPNPKGTLIDGQLVRVSVEADKPEEKVLVPQTALIVDQQGTYVFLVVDGKAAVRRVKLGGESGAVCDRGRWPQGRRAGVVQGMESLRPGTPVVASPAPPPLSGS